MPGLLAVAPAAERTTPQAGSGEEQRVISFLPKSFQRDPYVDQTVITEMTEAGRKLPPVSREKPVYYVAHAAGFHEEGRGPAEAPPSPASLDNNVQQALAHNGYRPAEPGKPPSLLIVYLWGSHYPPDKASVADDGDAAFPDVQRKNLLSRASLVGGTRFAAEFKTALNKEEAMTNVMQMPLLDPLHLFTERDARTRQLVEQSNDACYYVVISAYDYAEGARGNRILLWRSKMTVDAEGVAMADSLPSLIMNSGPYLGCDMPEAATMARRVRRTGSTKLGPMDVKEYLDKVTPPPPASKKP